MVHWSICLLSFLVGAMVGVFMMALAVAAKRND